MERKELNGERGIQKIEGLGENGGSLSKEYSRIANVWKMQQQVWMGLCYLLFNNSVIWSTQTPISFSGLVLFYHQSTEFVLRISKGQFH